MTTSTSQSQKARMHKHLDILLFAHKTVQIIGEKHLLFLVHES